MRINFYTGLIFLSYICAQTTEQDIFFLDMGIAIEPQNDADITSRLIKHNSNVESKNIVRNKESRSIYMAATSEVFSSLDKIYDQVTEIERVFASKLLSLEIENSRLRDQINNLNQKMNSEIINLKYENINSTKPEYIDPDPVEISENLTDMIDVDLPSDKMENFAGVSSVFDVGVYTKGMILYNNEHYAECIKHLKSLSLDGVNKRTSSNILFLLTESYENIGRYKQALNCLHKLSELDVDKYSDLVLIKKGLIYRDIGMEDEAQMVFKKILNIFPNSKYVSLAQEEIKNI
jgi:tetratricopeptide (TPR) repeat protein